MELNTNQAGEFRVIDISGRLDSNTASDFEKHIQELAGRHTSPKMIVDLSNLEYISSAGLRCILDLVKHLDSEEGALCLCNLSGMVKEVITMTGFDNFIPIYESTAAAKEALAESEDKS